MGMTRRATRPRPALFKSKEPIEERFRQEVFGRLPQRPYDDASLKTLIRTVVLQMKSEGLIT